MINQKIKLKKKAWDYEEKKRFLEAFEKYGNNWKEVSKYVGRS